MNKLCFLVSFFVTVFNTGVCEGQSNQEYLGFHLGNLTELSHVVSGQVYAVNAKTLYIRNFSYDGLAPALYFHGTIQNAPDHRGFRLKDSEYDGFPIRRYHNEGVILSLPDGVTLADLKYIYAWCEKFSLNFGDVALSPNFVEYPKPQRLGALKGSHRISSDKIIFLDAESLLIPNFFYDGKAPNAKFWVSGRNQRGLNSRGAAVPDENNSTYSLNEYNGKNIILRLPTKEIDFTIGYFGVFDEEFGVSFAEIPLPTLENLPPAISALKITPWKDCSNCEKQKAAFKISEIPTLTSFKTNVNTLEREFMTIDARVQNSNTPKTYYEAPVYKQQGNRRTNVIRDISNQACVAQIMGKPFYLVPYN